MQWMLLSEVHNIKILYNKFIPDFRCVSDFCSTYAYAETLPFEERQAQYEAVRCSSLGFYSQQCSAYGVILSWRNSYRCRK